MGMDKATLRIQGETLFQRQLDAFREVFSRVLIAGDRPDLASPEVPCVPDLYPGSALLRVPPNLGNLPGGWEGEAFPLRQRLLDGVF